MTTHPNPQGPGRSGADLHALLHPTNRQQFLSMARNLCAMLGYRASRISTHAATRLHDAVRMAATEHDRDDLEHLMKAWEQWTDDLEIPLYPMSTATVLIFIHDRLANLEFAPMAPHFIERFCLIVADIARIANQDMLLPSEPPDVHRMFADVRATPDFHAIVDKAKAAHHIRLLMDHDQHSAKKMRIENGLQLAAQRTHDRPAQPPHPTVPNPNSRKRPHPNAAPPLNLPQQQTRQRRSLPGTPTQAQSQVRCSPNAGVTIHHNSPHHLPASPQPQKRASAPSQQIQNAIAMQRPLPPSDPPPTASRTPPHTAESLSGNKAPKTTSPTPSGGSTASVDLDFTHVTSRIDILLNSAIHRHPTASVLLHSHMSLLRQSRSQQQLPTPSLQECLSWLDQQAAEKKAKDANDKGKQREINPPPNPPVQGQLYQFKMQHQAGPSQPVHSKPPHPPSNSAVPLQASTHQPPGPTSIASTFNLHVHTNGQPAQSRAHPPPVERQPHSSAASNPVQPIAHQQPQHAPRPPNPQLIDARDLIPEPFVGGIRTIIDLYKGGHSVGYLDQLAQALIDSKVSLETCNKFMAVFKQSCKVSDAHMQYFVTKLTALAGVAQRAASAPLDSGRSSKSPSIPPEQLIARRAQAAVPTKTPQNGDISVPQE